MKIAIIASTLIALTSAATPFAAQAAALTSSTFSTGTDGWVDGDLSDTGSPRNDVIWDSSSGTITSDDPMSGQDNAFIAPSSYLGNKSAALGGALSFELSDTQNDGVAYTPLSLISGSTVIYADAQAIPSTTSDTLTKYSVSLVDSSFYTGDPNNPASGTPVSAGTVARVLGNLTQISIDLDWHSGQDFTRLDNVLLSSPAGVGGVPEPAAWAMMMVGFAMIGVFARSRRGAPSLV